MSVMQIIKRWHTVTESPMLHMIDHQSISLRSLGQIPIKLSQLPESGSVDFIIESESKLAFLMIRSDSQTERRAQQGLAVVAAARGGNRIIGSDNLHYLMPHSPGGPARPSSPPERLKKLLQHSEFARNLVLTVRWANGSFELQAGNQRVQIQDDNVKFMWLNRDRERDMRVTIRDH